MLGFAARRLLGSTIVRSSRQRRVPNPLYPVPATSIDRSDILNHIDVPSTDAAAQMGKKTCYAVARGHKPGLYTNWPDCAAQVNGFPGNLYKGFNSHEEARQYLEQHDVPEVAVHSLPTATTATATTSLPVYVQQQQRQHNLKAEQNRVLARSAPPILQPILQPSNKKRSLEDPSPSGRTARMQFDGASKRNPGPAAFGAVLYDAETGKEAGAVYSYMGDCHTNNQAEYAGMIAGMQAALDRGYDGIEVQGDSKLVVNQVLGRWQVKNEGLKPYHHVAVALSRKFIKFSAKQVPRAENAVADALGNLAIDNWNSGAVRDVWTIAGAQATLAGDDDEQRGIKKRRI